VATLTRREDGVVTQSIRLSRMRTTSGLRLLSEGRWQRVPRGARKGRPMSRPGPGQRIAGVFRKTSTMAIGSASRNLRAPVRLDGCQEV
jgi:hypothetical protein